MIYNSKFNSQSNSKNHTFDNVDETIVFLQDIVHIGTKLRNRLLSSSTVLLIGEKIASVSHLKMLMNVASKDKHGLVYSDICPDDRQNYGSLQKIMEPKVRTALEEFVVGSEGSIEYIRMCQEITSSLYDDDLSPLDRLFLIWRSTFFLRACRQFITQATDINMKLGDNFITSNAYMCIELNAKNLIILIKHFRDENLTEYFIPTIFNSQPCEETYRKMRSMGTINFTKINFTLLELFHLIGRIELMNNIMYFKLADFDVIFPRDPLKKAKPNTFELPPDSEIEKIIAKALVASVNDARKFGMDVNQDDIRNCPLDFNPLIENKDKNTDSEFIDLGISRDDKPMEHENLKDYGINANETQDEKSRFVNVDTKSGKKTILKSSLMWSLTNSKDKLSTDRLRRVRGVSKASPRRQLEFVDVSLLNQPIHKANEVKIGDWCVFTNIFDENQTGFLLGNILSFRYVDGRTNAEKTYSLDFASVEKRPGGIPPQENPEKKNVEILASWYKMEMEHITGALEFVRNTFIHKQYYVANLTFNVIEKHQNNTIRLSRKHLKSIKNILPNFQ